MAIRQGRIAAVGGTTRGCPRWPATVTSATSRCCPGWSTATCTSTSRAAPSGRGSPPRPAAAAAGGVTTIVDMPLNSLPPTVDAGALAVKRAAAAGQCAVDVGFWGGAIPGNLADLRRLHEAGVYGFKCFLSPSGRRRVPAAGRAGQLRAAMTEIAAFGGLLIVHAEDPEHLSEPVGPGLRGVPASRPAAVGGRGGRAGDRRLGRGDRLPRAHRAPVRRRVAAGCSPQRGREGVPITAETCPHYLTLGRRGCRTGAPSSSAARPIRDAANRDAALAGPGRRA